MRKKHIIIGLIVVQLLVIGFIVYQYTGIGAVFSSFTFVSQQQSLQRDKITIAVPFSVSDFSPFNIDDRMLLIMKNMFEPLVDFDENLRIHPMLATSWGMLSPTEWEFTLRSGVVFHNGENMKSKDVLFTYQKMIDIAPNETKQLFSSIEKIESVSDYKIIITTHFPDPLLLAKLRYFFILPSNLSDEQLKAFPSNMVGTGPYVWKSTSNGVITLTRFNQYYKQEVVPYKTIQFVIVPKKFTRMELISHKEVDVVLSVPSDFVETVQQSGYTTVSMPTMESIFLLYNFGSVTQDRTIRETLSQTIDHNQLQTVIGILGKTASQYVPSGVFGFNPNVTKIPTSNISPLSQKVFLTMKLSKSNEAIGDIIVQNAARANIKIDAQPVDDTVLLSDLMTGKGDLFLLGWKFSDGDAATFYESCIHSRDAHFGQLNGLSYHFPDTDQLIEQARQEIDVKKRLKMLQDIMQQLVTYQVGIPLFESQNIYALGPGIHFVPRMDGMVLYSNFLTL